MSKRKEIIGQAGIYAFSAHLTQVITLIASVLSRRFLGPTKMGIWTTLQIIVDYSKYSSMGVLYGVAIQIPYLVGKGKKEKAEGIKNMVFTIVLGGSFLIGSGIFLFALFTKRRFPPELTYGLFLVSAIVVLQRLNDLMIALLRCYKKFTLASSQMIWSAVANAILVAGLSYFFKIYGFVWAVGLSFVFNILYIHRHHPFHFRLHWQTEEARALIGFGFPLMIIGVMTTVIRSIDKIMIGKCLGFEALGLYSIALMVSTYLQTFFNSIAIVMLPHLQEKFSLQDDPRDLKGFLSQVSQAYALGMPVVIGIAWIAAPYFIALLLPKFIPGIAPMKNLIVGMYFLALAQPYCDFLITIKRYLSLFPLMGISALAACLLDLWAIRSGFGIAGVAFATSFGSLLYFSVIYFFASRYFTQPLAALQKYLTYLAGAAYLLLALFLVNRWLPSNFHSLPRTILQLAVFLVFYAPFLWILSRQLALVPLLREKWAFKKIPAVSSLNIEET